MRTWTKCVVLSIVAAMVCGVALAQFTKPEEAIDYRQSAMVLIGQHFGRMAAMVKGERPYNKAEFAHNAAVVQMVSELPWDAFMMAGSAKGETKMKAAALTEKDKFMADAEKLETETRKLAEAADAGDLNAIKAQFNEVANACKLCHTSYRNK
jgi:cytochrome c556